MKLLHYNNIDKEQWQQLVDESPVATFFQTEACYRFYASLSFMKPFVVAVSEDGRLCGLVCGYVIADGNPLKQFFSRRAIVPGGALLASDISAESLKFLLEAVKKELSGQAIYIEFRNYNDYTATRSVFEEIGFQYNAHLNFHVATPDVETALLKLSSSKRRQIKQTLKAGAEIVKAQTAEEVGFYYLILKTLYKERVKSPLFPIEFFEKLIQLSNADIWLIKMGDKILGGITCVYLQNKSVSEWFVCGDDTNVDKNVYPSVLATWAGIQYAAENQYMKFDFMGAGKPDDAYGVREFKSKFGGELVEHGRFLYICKPRLYSFGKYMVKKIKSGK